MLDLNGSFFALVGIVAVVMIALNFLVFGPLAAFLDRRRAAFASVETDISALEQARDESGTVYDRRLATERASILAQKGSSLADLERERAAVIDESQIKADAFLHKEIDDLKADVAEARKVLHRESDLLAADIFANLVGRRPEGR
jgi:F0F1-type ATP synthase membrane subunit b/b'